MQQVWHYLLEPCTWLFYCFFQPIRFKREFEKDSLNRKHLVSMIRLTLPIFVISCILVFIIRAILSTYSPTASSLPSTSTTVIGLTLGVASGFALGVIGGLRLGIVGGLTLGITAGLMKGIAFAVTSGALFGLAEGPELSITGFIAGGISLGITQGVTDSVVGAIALGTAGGIALSIRRISNTGGIIVGGIVGFIVWFIGETITRSISGGTQSIIGGITFIISYIIGYYRLPLYPVSVFSGLRAYFASRRNPLQVFTYLQRSSLYWDERIFLPLPGLKSTLLLAAEEDVERALEEITFIVHERPQQFVAAQTALLGIVIHDLEMRDSLRDIARASQQLDKFLLQEGELIDPRYVTPLARLNDASRDAASYCSPIGWQAQRDALEDMIVNLKRIYPHTAFKDPDLNRRLSEVVNTWLATSRQELKNLEQGPKKAGHIDNPYNPGNALKLRDSLFVGRRDVAQQLSEALGRGSHRPTFLLHGERRMGKSSTLRQLPDLLGAHYLPIFYDLQTPGISSSAATFLSVIAKEIYEVIASRGMRIKKLEYLHLREASRENEAAVYHRFDEWLEELEYALEQENRTLLLTFDEFEQMEEAGQNQHLNLKLLLNWFRSMIQNRQRVALLFSGVRTFGDMGMNWAGYFVNVQTLKVSFLQPVEALQLITRPISNFPSEQVFGEGVVDEIMRLTGCHPFLVQAICSVLIDYLNADNRNQAEIQDVAIAMSRVLKSWGSTYFQDLWERTNDDQRVCLIALKNLGEGTSSDIEQQTGLEGRTVRRTLEILLDRDLILLNNDVYRIAAPIFYAWIERNSDD